MMAKKMVKEKRPAGPRVTGQAWEEAIAEIRKSADHGVVGMAKEMTRFKPPKGATQALAYACEVAKNAPDWAALHNALFGIGGKCTQLFSTDAQRTAFAESPQFAAIGRLLDALRERTGDPPALADRLATANGKLSVRMPRSLHAALLAEAEAEGVSLNQLCLAKLAVQLRAVV